MSFPSRENLSFLLCALLFQETIDEQYDNVLCIESYALLYTFEKIDIGNIDHLDFIKLRSIFKRIMGLHGRVNSLKSLQIIYSLHGLRPSKYNNLYKGMIKPIYWKVSFTFVVRYKIPYTRTSLT